MIIGIPSVVNKIIDKFFRNKKCVKFGKEGYGYCYHIYPKIKKGGLVISGGVGSDIFFELELYKKYSAEILIFDPTPIAKGTIKKQGNLLIKYFPFGLSGKSETISLEAPPERTGCDFFEGNGKSEKFECKSVSEIAKGRVVELLKIDIEGSEYGVIDDVLENGVRVNQIVLEFHHWFKDIPLMKTISAIRKLRKAGYVLVYKNMDDYTFVKKGLLD